MMIIQAVVLSIILVLMVAVIIRTIYFAFFAKRDERMKHVVIKSLAHAFCVVFTMQFFHAALRLGMPHDAYNTWWGNVTDVIYVDPSALSLIVLGVMLIINQRRHT